MKRQYLKKIRGLKDELKTLDLKSIQPDSENKSGKEELSGPEDYTAYRDQVASEIKKHDFALSSSASKSSSWEKKGDTLIIFCNDKFSADTLTRGKTVIAEELQKVTGENLKIEVRIEEKGKSEDNSSESGEVSEQVELVKKIFKGEVLETKIVKDDSYEF